MSAVPSGGSTIKNVLIGIGTTVIAYLIVHFLLDKKSSSDEKGKKKKSTIEAWKSLIKYEEISSSNFYTAYCNEDPENQLEGMIYEKDQLIKNYEIIKSSPDIDEDMTSFITRAIGNTNESNKILQSFLTDLKKLKVLQPLVNMKDPEFIALNDEYTKKITLAQSRDKDALGTIYKTLVDKYGNEFKGPEEAGNYTESSFYGKWKETGIDKLFNLKPDHTFIMTLDSTDYSGTWHFAGKEISLTYDDKSSLKIHVLILKDQLFIFKLNEESLQRQCCRL